MREAQRFPSAPCNSFEIRDVISPAWNTSLPRLLTSFMTFWAFCGLRSSPLNISVALLPLESDGNVLLGGQGQQLRGVVLAVTLYVVFSRATLV